MKKPNSMRHLDDAIRRLSGNTPQRLHASAHGDGQCNCSEYAPRWSRQGRHALKMRFGDAETRLTTDLDTATALDPMRYAAQLDSIFELDGKASLAG